MEVKNKNISEGTKKKLRNLRPFQKGPDPRRNMEGRPQGSVSIVEGIKKKLLDIEPESKRSYLELFLEQLFQKSVKEGNEQLMRDMINRVDGMPKQFNDLTSGGEKLTNLIQINESHKS